MAGTRDRGCSPLFLSLESLQLFGLENQSEPKLQLTSPLLRRVVSEVGAVYVVFRTEAVHVIEYVICLNANLGREVFVEHQVLEERRVDIFLALSAEDITT